MLTLSLSVGRSDSDPSLTNGDSHSHLPRRLRPTPSANDVKALFDSPHGYYADSPSTQSSSATTTAPSTSATSAYDNGGSALPSPPGSGNGFDRNGGGGSYNTGRHQISDFWSPPVLPPPPAGQHGHAHAHHGASASISNASSSAGGYHPTHERSHSSVVHNHHLPLRPTPEESQAQSQAQTYSSKRGSDPSLASKLASITSPCSSSSSNNPPHFGGAGGGGWSHQRAAQSLDMGSLPSLTHSGRTTDAGSGGVGSPPGSAGFAPGKGWGGGVGGGGGGMLYNSKRASAGPGVGGRGQVGSSEMDEVARVIEGLELA